MRTAGVMVLSFVLCLSFAPFSPAISPAHADVHGIAYGFVQSVEPDFDGLGTCRMVLFDQHYNVLDFPQGELADACEAAPPGVFHYFEAIVDDLDLIPCEPKTCSRTSAMSHYLVGAVIIP